MVKFYPVFIKKNDFYVVYIPDFDIYTEGKSMEDAIYMARDAIGMCRLGDKSAAPEPSAIDEARRKTKELADDGDFKFSDEMVTLIDIDIDFEIYEKKLLRIEDK